MFGSQSLGDWWMHQVVKNECITLRGVIEPWNAMRCKSNDMEAQGSGDSGKGSCRMRRTARLSKWETKTGETFEQAAMVNDLDGKELVRVGHYDYESFRVGAAIHPESVKEKHSSSNWVYTIDISQITWKIINIMHHKSKITCIQALSISCRVRSHPASMLAYLDSLYQLKYTRWRRGGHSHCV